ncbi:unnamed protein product [Mesocestoides corti]|uniref:Major facilitator superfamily (MFS) profile domain-containing protein n=2 Tax=Mesocestoides corti TaxID=53468 RepID=A0A0R3URF7_MESCO|nr:unnamed protein product [Mesocestoides corti]
MSTSCNSAAFGFLHLPSIICVSFYFDSRRALAIGITSCGTPLGAMVFAPLTEVLLKKYGWANTLILFAGMLLNCTVMAALYRPLTPALVLTPMKSKEADAIKSLLQLAAQPPEGLDAGDRVGGTTPVMSQRDLRDQPVMEEPEGEAETAFEAKSDSETVTEHDKQPQQQQLLPQPTQLEPISESPEGELEADDKIYHEEAGGGGKEEKEIDEAVEAKSHSHPHHHHHHHRRRRDHRQTWQRHLNQQYSRWLQGIRLLFGSKNKNDVAFDDDADDSDSSGFESSISTCGSSCDEENSHWDSSDAEVVEGADGVNPNELLGTLESQDANKLQEKLRPPIKSTRHRAVSSDCNNLGVSPNVRNLGDNAGKVIRAPYRAPSASECVLSAPNLDRHSKDYSGRPVSSIRSHKKQRRTHQSECHSSRFQLKPIPRQSVVHLAHASVPRRRAESVAMSVLSQSHLSALGSQFFTSAAGGIENAEIRGIVSTLELADGAPVIVELPHESITVEDYARPLYRKDIFFP